MKKTLDVLVNDQPGVLVRVAGLFARRGYNIESLTVGPAEERGLSRMTIATRCDEAMLEQMVKQLYKLIDVIKVRNISDVPVVERELLLIKVSATSASRAEIVGITEPFRAAIVDVGRSTLIVQATGDGEKNDALIDLLRPYGITEISRTGVTSMVRSQVTQLKAVAN